MCNIVNLNKNYNSLIFFDENNIKNEYLKTISFKTNSFFKKISHFSKFIFNRSYYFKVNKEKKESKHLNAWNLFKSIFYNKENLTEVESSSLNENLERCLEGEIENIKKDPECSRDMSEILNIIFEKRTKLFYGTEEIRSDALNTFDKKTLYKVAYLVCKKNAPYLRRMILNYVNIELYNEDEHHPLNRAIKEGNKSILNILINNCKANKITYLNSLALIRAAQEGRKEIAEMLIKNGADVNYINKRSGDTPLMWAAYRGHSEIAKMLIKKGANVNYINEKNGYTPLMFAAQEGRKEIAKMLINKKANVNSIAKCNGYTSLMLAARHGYKEIAEMLINNKADVNYINKKKGDTPLMLAAHRGHSEIAEMLIKNGANVNYISKQDGYTPLIWAAESGYKEIAKMLINNKADVNSINEKDGYTPLMWAAESGYKEIAKMLIKKGANVNSINEKDGYTPLMFAVESGHKEIAKMLINEGANVNYINKKDGYTSLMWAARHGRKELIEMLIKNGADVNSVNEKDGYTALMWAARYCRKEIAEMLINNKAKVNCIGKDGYTPLMWAAYRGHSEIAEMFINNKADVNYINKKDGYTPLMRAAYRGHRELAEMFINNKADVNYINKHDGYTPLMRAVLNGHKEIAEMLIKNGANVNSISKQDSYTPLMRAVLNGHKEIAEMLIKNGANVNSISKQDGYTPLMLAAYRGHSEIAEMLINNKANVNSINKRELLMLAANRKHIEKDPFKRAARSSIRQNFMENYQFKGVYNKSYQFKKEFESYISNQEINKTNNAAIMVLNAKYDHNGSFKIGYQDENFRGIRDLSKRGYILNKRVASIGDVNKAVQSTAKKIETLLVRGHGGLRGKKARWQHIIALSKPGPRLDLVSDTFAPTIPNTVKSVILKSCNSGSIYVGEDGKLMGGALDLAHCKPGVRVFGRVGLGYNSDLLNYFRSKDGVIGVWATSNMDPHKENVYRDFYVDPNKNYESLEDLREAAKNLKTKEGREEFKNLLYNSKLPVAELKRFYNECKKGNSKALKIFNNVATLPAILNPKKYNCRSSENFL